MAFLQGLDSHIVVVGCGISGIGAAQQLLQHGFHNVRVLEATGRSGGRVKTGRLGESYNVISCVSHMHAHVGQ